MVYDDDARFWDNRRMDERHARECAELQQEIARSCSADELRILYGYEDDKLLGEILGQDETELDLSQPDYTEEIHNTPIAQVAELHQEIHARFREIDKEVQAHLKSINSDSSFSKEDKEFLRIMWQATEIARKKWALLKETVALDKQKSASQQRNREFLFGEREKLNQKSASLQREREKLNQKSASLQREQQRLNQFTKMMPKVF